MSAADGPGRGWLTAPVVVRTPATSANLGPGFDALGLALGLHDEVEARVIASGLRIEVRGVGEDTAGLGEGHLVVRAMRAMFGALGGQPPGLELRCENAIPHGFGLGSSAAAIVAGMLAARALAGERGAALSEQDVLALAAEFEGHADNVAACLAGGLTIAWSDTDPRADAPGAAGNPGGSSEDLGGGSRGPDRGRVRCLRLEPLAGLIPVLCLPAVPLSTKAARQVLPPVIPHSDAARNAARSALLIAALTGVATRGSAAARGGDDDLTSLLLAATTDFLHQPYRAGSMPDSAKLIAALREQRIPAVVSGAGPAVLALVVAGTGGRAEDVSGVAGSSGKSWDVRVLEVDRTGAVVRAKPIMG